MSESRYEKIRPIAAAGLLALFAGCASLPAPIAEAPPGDLQMIEAMADPDAHRGTRVRWGGKVLAVEQRGGTLWVEVLERQLDAWGKPSGARTSGGRFFAVVENTEGAGDFAYGWDVTVYGVLDGAREGIVGNQTRIFPVVRVLSSYAWAPYEPHLYPSFHYGLGYRFRHHFHGGFGFSY